MEVPNSNLLFKVDLQRLSDPDSTQSDEDTYYKLDAFDANSLEANFSGINLGSQNLSDGGKRLSLRTSGSGCLIRSVAYVT